LQKLCRRQGVAAVAFRRGGAVDAHLLEAFDHVPWHVGEAVELVAALAYFFQHLRKGRALDDILVNAWQSVLLRDR
jgi:hypothetical protein